MMLDELRAQLASRLGGERAAALWLAIDDLVIKTMLTVESPMAHALRDASAHVARGWPNRSCFEVLGFDVLIDAQAKPWLLEVNLDPALHTGEHLGLATGPSPKGEGSEGEGLCRKGRGVRERGCVERGGG